VSSTDTHGGLPDNLLPQGRARDGGAKLLLSVPPVNDSGSDDGEWPIWRPVSVRASVRCEVGRLEAPEAPQASI